MKIEIKKTLQKAITAHQEGKLEEAENLYRLILSVEPEHLDANINLGILLFKLGNLHEVENIYKKVLELKPDHLNANNNLGAVLLSLGKFTASKNIYQKIIKLKPDYVDAHNNLGFLFFRLNKLVEAETSFKKALELNPDHTNANINLNNVTFTLKERKKAKDYCEKVLKVQFNESPVLMSFAYQELAQRGFFSWDDLESTLDETKCLPLLTWPFLDFIKTVNLKDLTLHELGSGKSTFWFSNIFKRVESYETNEAWYKKLKPQLKDNVSLQLIKLEDIYDCLIKFKKADWLLIDFAGSRTKFVNKLVELSDNQIPAQIIFDNSEIYRNGAKILSNRGFIEIPFYGFGLPAGKISCTSVFLLKNNFNIETLSEFYYPISSVKKDKSNLWDLID
jgi:tetratricopeptide (TPR) repeat protein